MLHEQLDWMQRIKNQVDVQQPIEQIEVLIDLIGGLVFEVSLPLAAKAIVAVLKE